MRNLLAFSMVIISFLMGTANWAFSTNVPAKTISFDQPLHFQGSEGTAIVVVPGVYQVSPLVGGRLQLQAEGAPPVFLEAEVSLHEETLEWAEAALVPDEENPDFQHLVLLLPDGQAMTALGSTTGLFPRGFKKPWKKNAGLQQLTLSRRQSQPPVPSQTPASPPRNPATPSTTILPGSSAAPLPPEATQEGQGEFVGMVTWGYLRMHHPDMVLEELKQVQAGKQNPNTLTGLAGEGTLRRLLGSNLSKVILPQAASSGVVSRGLFGKIGSPTTQVGSGAVSGLKNSPPPAPTIGPPVTLSPGLGLDRLGKEISPSPPPTTLPPNVLKVPSEIKDTQRAASYLKDAWTALLAGPQNISPERRAPLPVDYFPNTLNLGHAWDQQFSTATVHLVAPSEGTVTASMPEGTPFRVIEIQTYSGKVMPSSGNSPFQATTRVSRRPDFPETTLIAPPFRLPVKAGQDVTVTVEFSPKFNLFKEAAGEKRTTLHVEGNRWSADVPVTGFFEGLPLGVLGTLATHDVVFIEQPSYQACNLKEGGDKNPAKIPLIASFRNTDSETHVVAVRPERLDIKGRWSLQPFTIELKGNETRQVTMTLEGDRCTGLQSGIFESEIRYHFYEGPTKPGGTRSLRFTLSVYPGVLIWEKAGTVGSCDYRWLYSASSQGDQGLYFQVYNDNIVFGMHFYVDIVLYNQKWMSGYGYARQQEGTHKKTGPFKNPLILDRYRELASGKQPGYTVRCSVRTGD